MLDEPGCQAAPDRAAPPPRQVPASPEPPDPRSAQVPDGHACGWSPNTGPSLTADSRHVNYTRGVICDGLVRRIDLTVEVIYHGHIRNGVSAVVAGCTRVVDNVTSQWLGATTPESDCSTGYYSGRATATVQFRSGVPEFITQQITSSQRFLSCFPPPIDL
jgi:hypothetical protein